ncbi:MAG: hypothetical protein QNJ62_09900 [Methyloceanibacter sp.]|nr:hypothetical protein [Methyloceanibacter sp.]
MNDDSFSDRDNGQMASLRRSDEPFFGWRINQALNDRDADWLVTLVAHWLHVHDLRVSDEARALFVHILDKLNQTTEH